MTAVREVSGAELADVLRDPPDALAGIEVTTPPPSWAAVKPLFLRLARAYRERGRTPPLLGGVPLCLFGSEWPGIASRPRTTPAVGGCARCQARHACAFAPEVPAELLPISEAPLVARWRDFAAAFRGATGSAAALDATPLVERIAAAYRGPVSLEPSVLLTSESIEPVARVVVFPHRLAPGAAGAAEYADVLDCVRALLAEIGADPSANLLARLASLPPLPMPVGIEGGGGTWRVKAYLRLEDKTTAEKAAVLAALLHDGGARTAAVALPDLQMLGLVLDAGGRHTVKAYVGARPSGPQAAGFPAPLPVDHPLVLLGGDRALATLDVWRRESPRPDKWDVNLRDHYLAGASAERFLARLVPGPTVDRFRALLVGPSYRADVVAVGVRGRTLAPYMELN